MFCLITIELRNAFIFPSYVVNTCVDLGGYGIDAAVGEVEAFLCLRFGGGFSEAGANCGVAVPVGCEGEEFAEFGGVVCGNGGA